MIRLTLPFMCLSPSLLFIGAEKAEDRRSRRNVLVDGELAAHRGAAVAEPVYEPVTLFVGTGGGGSAGRASGRGGPAFGGGNT